MTDSTDNKKVLALAEYRHRRALTTSKAGEILAAGPELVPYPGALLEAGVFAYRYGNNGMPRILIVSKRRSKRWGIPKGKLKPQFSFSENAAKEAFEEAGVRGKVSPNAFAVFRTTQRILGTKQRKVLEVWVYLLEVTERLAVWPEKGKRKRRWVSCERAAAELREPALAHLCELFCRTPWRHPAHEH